MVVLKPETGMHGEAAASGSGDPDVQGTESDAGAEELLETQAAADRESNAIEHETMVRSNGEEEQRDADDEAISVKSPRHQKDALMKKELELRQLQKAHDEYVKSSCEYEKELETEVELCEKKVLALEQTARAMEVTKEQLQVKLGEVLLQLEATHTRELVLQSELQEMKWKVQRLEQANDELETAARIAQASIEDLEHKTETLLEQNVFLQHEKEEVVRQIASITVAEVHPTPKSSSSLSSSSSHSKSNLHHSENRSAGDSMSPETRKYKQHARGSVKSKGRYPEVVESCLHITCRQCRPHKPHQHHSRRHSSAAAEASFHGPPAEEIKKRAIAGFFDRLRLRLRAIFDCERKGAAAKPTMAAP